jgi:hypothetical protein
MSSRNMRLLPWAALRSDSEQGGLEKWCGLTLARLA